MTGLIADGMFAAAARTPRRIALRYGAHDISYGDFAQRVRAVASGVDASGARRVAVSLENHPAILELMFGVTSAGGVLVVFEPRWPVTIKSSMVDMHAPHLVFDEPERFEAWRDAQDGARALRAPPTPDMPFMIGFTSGTTGLPKAFIRAHRTWTQSFGVSRIEYGTSDRTTVLLPGPLSHGLSLYAAVEALTVGGTAVIAPRFDAAEMMDLACAGEVNTITAAPTLLDLMLAARPEARGPGVHSIVTAGAKLSPGLRSRLSRAFPAAEITEYYGASELSFVTIAAARDNPPPDSVGRAATGVDLAVRRDDGSAAPSGEVGTVWVRSPMLCGGYVGPNDGSGFRCVAGWATVGDRGRLDAQGFLTLIGREGDMILTGGLNVYPSEVEDVLYGVPGVAEALVMGTDEERWGQVVTAVIAGSAGREDLRVACKTRLPSWKVPRLWLAIDAFPRTASGKIDRGAVKALVREQKLTRLI